MNPNNKIEKLDEHAELPWDLLLLADETREAVYMYLDSNSETYVTKDSNTGLAVGVVVIYRDKTDNSIEIKNIAVKEDIQSNGVGTKMIDRVKTIARNEGFSRVTVGTSITT